MAFNWNKGIYQHPPSVWHVMIVVFLQTFSTHLSPDIYDSFYRITPTNERLLIDSVHLAQDLLTFCFAPLIGRISDAGGGRKCSLLLSVIGSGLFIPFLYWDKFPYVFVVLYTLSWNSEIISALAFAYAADIKSDCPKIMGVKIPLNTFGLITLANYGGSFCAHYSNIVFTKNGQLIKLGTLTVCLNAIFIALVVPESRLIRRIGHMNNPVRLVQERPARNWNNKMLILICLAVFIAEVADVYQFYGMFTYFRSTSRFDPTQLQLLVFVTQIVILTIVVTILLRSFGAKKIFAIGLLLQSVQAAVLGLSQEIWMDWAGSIIHLAIVIKTPAIGTYISTAVSPDQQGFTHGLVMGIFCLSRAVVRICSRFIPFLDFENLFTRHEGKLISGPTFLIISMLALFAFSIALFIPEEKYTSSNEPQSRSGPLHPAEEILELNILDNNCMGS